MRTLVRTLADRGGTVLWLYYSYRWIDETIILLSRFGIYFPNNLHRTLFRRRISGRKLVKAFVRRLLNPSYFRTFDRSISKRVTTADSHYAKVYEAETAVSENTRRIILLLLQRTCNLYVTYKLYTVSFTSGLLRPALLVQLIARILVNGLTFARVQSRTNSLICLRRLFKCIDDDRRLMYSLIARRNNYSSISFWFSLVLSFNLNKA